MPEYVVGFRDAGGQLHTADIKAVSPAFAAWQVLKDNRNAVHYCDELAWVRVVADDGGWKEVPSG